MSDDEAERTIAADAEVDGSETTSAGAEGTETASADSAADASAASPTSQSAGLDEETDVERAADSFLALESELQGLDGGPDGLSGYAADVERVPATEVPDGYPVTITTEEALRLRVRGDAGAETATLEEAVYFEWPPSDDGPLSRLLALRGIDRDRFADLNGKRVPLAVEDGFLVPRVPPTAPRGSENGVYGILGGLAASLGLLGLVATGTVSLASLPVLTALTVVTFVVLPLSTYLDAWHLLSTTDWEGGPAFWTALSAIPGVNVLTSLWYLFQRRDADPL